MTHADLAKKIREAIFDQAEEDGRVMHGDAMDAVIEKALNTHSPQPAYPSYAYGACVVEVRDGYMPPIEPGNIYVAADPVYIPEPTEWR